MRRIGTEQELLAAAYAAFNARDISSALAWMHPDVDWPNGMEGGRVHGHIGIRGYWERQWSVMEPLVEPIRFEKTEGGQMAVAVHQVIRDLAGRVVSDQIVQHVYTIQDHLIQRMDITKATD
jgi:hypothetical protein